MFDFYRGRTRHLATPPGFVEVLFSPRMMPVTRSQAAQQEGDDILNDEGAQNSDEVVRSPFEAELLSVVQEQRELLKQYKRQQEIRVQGLVDVVNNTMLDLSTDFSRVCDRNKELEAEVADLRGRVEHLETDMKTKEEQFEKVNAKVLASLHQIIKNELREEFNSLVTARIKPESVTTATKDQFPVRFNDPEHTDTPRESIMPSSTPISKVLLNQDEKQERSYTTTTRATDISAGRPVQKPAEFDGRLSWEAYITQFQIVAEINQWEDAEKAAFLATSLRGQALTVLSNLPPESRKNFQSLLTALESRFGNKRQSELHRMKLRNRIRRRDETLPEVAEDIERLARLAYPDAPVDVLETLTKDQFIDALIDEELRLRVA